MERLQLKQMLTHFLKEDIGFGDVSADAIFGDKRGTAYIIAKQSGVLAGSQVIETGYHLLNEKIHTELFLQEGDWIHSGAVLAQIRGSVNDLLKGERVILNMLQRMTGISTLTHEAVQRLADPSIMICDTRKTTPGLRMLEKYAVKVGGGKNHRFGLSDGVMIKDNHIAACGSIREAVEKARAYVGHMVKIEVEIESEAQLKEAIAAKADVIMFDNCSPAQVKHFKQMTPETILTEASGGITLETLPSYRGTGVDIISLGFLTHSAPSFDFSMNMEFSHKGGTTHVHA
ncbi:carboxylating nicotinate-nucleotide diphosphorylase [Bacillus stratosphericus]|uniref:carboxylating nicotinate-nucleotide diphosphorylase n=1 Tax=Bacillus stratosphericus TaxID=293386 RepID=UPI001CFB3A1B|nr:carboxylating nicotinate-nucleotide diphosphorylase [Bacillus stratosphericus]